MNINSLRLFYHVAHHGSFSRAATATSISQPAISRAVAELEASLGFCLLDRSRRPLVLTTAGNCLFAHAETIFGAERQAHLDLAGLAQPVEHRLRIGASAVLMQHVVSDSIATFLRERPSATIDIIVGNLHSIAHAIGNGRLDIAIVEGLSAGFQHLPAMPWRDQLLVVLAPADHPLTQARKPVEMASLSGCPFVHRESGSATAGYVAKLREDWNIVPSAFIEAPDTATMLSLAAAGVGITVAPMEAATAFVREGRLAIIDVAVGILSRTNQIIRPQSDSLHPDLAAFERHVTRCAQAKGGEPRTEGSEF